SFSACTVLLGRCWWGVDTPCTAAMPTSAQCVTVNDDNNAQIKKFGKKYLHIPLAVKMLNDVNYFTANTTLMLPPATSFLYDSSKCSTAKQQSWQQQQTAIRKLMI
ncbi:unnamed protein product, partial [Ceratitis capitata]